MFLVRLFQYGQHRTNTLMPRKPKRLFSADPGSHPRRLQTFLRVLMTPGLVPGRKVGRPGWWRLRDTKPEEFRANQRVLAFGLLAATVALTVLLVLHASGKGVRITDDGVAIVGLIWVLTGLGGTFLLRGSKR